MDIDHLRGWVGAEAEASDEISPRLANSLSAVLDGRCDLGPGDPAPAGIHWCLSPEIAPMSGLGPDGHPARGGFLPPVPLPRRMWAGGELAYADAFRVGDRVTRRSRVEDVVLKQGRTGALCFVTVRHEHRTGRAGLALTERHDIVYRDLDPPGAASAPPPAPSADLPVPEHSDSVAATPVLLSRYSAVTFNGHRIHYDRDYCRDEEGYPGLIVHGPLQATYLLALSIRMAGGAMPARFAFRGLSPLFDGPDFTVNGAGTPRGQVLWTAAADGRVTMRATVTAD